MADGRKERASKKDSGPIIRRREESAKSGRSSTSDHRLEMVEVARCRLLERNPQYLTPKQLAALKRSIERDGFTVPILVRPRGEHYEIVSGNHRFMAARDLGHEHVPAVVADLSDSDAKRLAINLNLIHGNPLAEQLAPYLADCTDEVLGEIFLEDEMIEDVKRFDAELASTLARLEAPKSIDAPSVTNEIRSCVCKTCGKRHMRGSKSTSDDQTSIDAQSASSTSVSIPPS